ncbi:hypothetical protein [Bacillus cereus]|uniref:hypothetical protein n=1 Tax=Bacillus cereus TaxID=1396 RepID=UPI0034D6830C
MNTFLHNAIGVNEAASILNVSPGYVKNRCAEGKQSIRMDYVVSNVNVVVQ